MLAVFQGHAEARRKVQRQPRKTCRDTNLCHLGAGICRHAGAAEPRERRHRDRRAGAVQGAHRGGRRAGLGGLLRTHLYRTSLDIQKSQPSLCLHNRALTGCHAEHGMRRVVCGACIRCKTFDRCARRSSRSPTDKPALTCHTLRLAPSCRKLMLLQEEGAAALVDWTLTRWSCWCSASEGSST